jgi:uncharacterized protein YukE
MPGQGFELYGNVGELQNLAGVQHTYRGRFEGILGQIQTAVGTVTPKWTGAGLDGFTTFNKSSETEFTDVQAAFNKLATATEDAGTNWDGSISRINGMWGS